MKSRSGAFNIYLLCLLAGLAAGCKSTGTSKSGKELGLLSLHLEVNPDGTERSRTVLISRDSRIPVHVQVEPFLDQRSITNAAVVDDALGGFAITLRMDRRGTWILEQVTTAYREARMAVLGQWMTNAKQGQFRWLAAPIITHSITNGVLTFTPDADREEAQKLVAGLNQVAVELGNAPKPKKKSAQP
jgi:preprotein translocase subunit SecD